jgi:cysteine sulfinate desulfinase/cysteine desulfurase-like protein
MARVAIVAGGAGRHQRESRAACVRAVFVIASVPALVTGGRWLKSFGAGGLVADDAAGLRGALEAAQRELDRTTRDLEAVKKERDDLKVLIDRLPEER